MNGRPRIPHAEMVERLRGMIWSKRCWLDDHGKDRPQFDQHLRRRELEALEQALFDYERAARRDQQEEMAQ